MPTRPISPPQGSHQRWQWKRYILKFARGFSQLIAGSAAYVSDAAGNLSWSVRNSGVVNSALWLFPGSLWPDRHRSRNARLSETEIRQDYSEQDASMAVDFHRAMAPPKAIIE